MKKVMITMALAVFMIFSILPAITSDVSAATAPTKLWVASSDTNGIPLQIDLFKVRTGGTTYNPTYTYQIYLPGNANLEECFLSWDGDTTVTIDGVAHPSGECPIPALNTETTYAFKNGTQTLASLKIIAYQGSVSVPAVFIDIDESDGNPTIAQMDGDADHNVTCKGDIYIDGQKYELTKMKGRGNASWKESDDKKPYNLTLGKKINFPGIDSEKTKKWSILAEVLDHSLLCNRSGFYLAHKMGIGQDTASADIWMNGEYQGCYMVTPKTDSFVTKSGFQIEQDNYLEDSVANGGDPQFKLTGLNEASGWSSCYNRITVKKMGDDLLGYDESGEVDESPTNMENVATYTIKPWLQDAWDAIRSDTGYNSKGKYYTDYIDIESFAQMYLMHEYVKSYDVCAGSILFHRDGMTDDDKLKAGPLWDLDNAMGSVYQNSSLGKADDRRNGDRRSAKGSFISNVTEYKTSIYKTISKHPDFMTEVYKQYNKYRTAFDNLSVDVDQMISDVRASAMMNHRKVNDLGHNQGKNNHYYGSNTTLEPNDVYKQTYLATTDSKTDWGNYAANLKTYITVRSLWFHNTYFDENYVCEHEYKTVVTPPTCTAEGYTTYTCKFCGDSYTDDPTPKIAHDYQLDGETGAYACSVCHEALINVGITCTNGASVTVYETQDITGAHVDNAINANPRDGDTGLIDCSGEGQVNLKVNLMPGYALDSVTGDPSKYKNLKVIDEVNGVYRFAKVSGDFVITVNAHCTHSALTHVNAKDASCEDPGNTEYWSCETCGKYFSDEGCGDEIEADSWIIPATGHTPVTDEAVAPTCTETGLTEGSHCSVCEAVLTAQEEVPALGHDLVNHEGQAATCTEIGWDAYDTCSRCDYTTYVEIPALGHTPEVIPMVLPTCELKGSTAGEKCSVCGEILKAPEEIAALGHNWDEGRVTTEPTCEEKGVRTFVCQNDITHIRTEDIPALGHDIEHHEAKSPTCTEVGWDEYDTCKRCDYTTYEEIPALGHDLVHHEAKAPTCTEIGWDEYDTCKRCDYTTYEEIKALGHDLEHHDAKAATCTAIGWDEYDTCKRCDYTTYEEIKALGHDLEHHDAKAATCTEIGWDEYDTCKRCDYTTYEEIKALGHDLEHHDAKAATCTEVGWDAYDTCKRCDYTTYEEIKALGHDLEHLDAKAATCTEIGWDAYDTCSRCDYTTYEEIPALGHDLKHHDAKAPTCTEIGWDAYDTCSRCDYTTYKEKVALGHDLEHHDAKAPTCTEIGWDAYDTCKRCDYTTYEEIKALGHDLEHHDAKAATCTEVGWDEYDTCKRCDYTTYEEIKALGHDLEHHDAKAPTCTEIGWDEYDTCKRCDYTTYEEIKALGHDLVNHEAKAPTCTEVGWDAYDTCKRCDYTTYEEIKALGHDLEHHDAKAATCTAIGWDEYDTCKRCDYTTYEEIKALGHDLEHHDAKAATCTEIGWDEYDTCKRCDYTTYEEIKALGHDLEHHDAKAATCTAIGWDEYDTCKRCDYTTYEEIKALGHDLEHHDAKAATCTEVGWDEYDTCKRCDYTTYEEIKALGHDLEHHDAKAATCTEVGWDEYDTCKRCDYTTYEEIKALGHDLEHHDAKAPTCTEIGWDEYDTCKRCDYTTYKEKEALGHTPVTIPMVLPTCEKTGLTAGEKCSVCGEILTAQKEIPAIGHNWDEGRVTTEPTCEEKGVMTYVCQNDITHVRTEEIAALGHTTEVIPAVAPTCTKKGSTAGEKCSVCGKTLKAPEEIAALGHTAEVIPAVAPTCTKKGSTAGEKCSVCGEILKAPEEIAALGHTTEVIPAEAPTCTKKGSTAGEKCSVCGEILKAPEEIPALGHTTEVIPEVAPTCTEKGSTAGEKCSVCGEILKAPEEIAALGHDWNEEYSTDRVPTCTEEGLESIHCKRCNAIQEGSSRAIDKTAHTYGDWTVTHESSCTEEGTRERVCSVCGDVNKETIPMTDHHWNKDYTVDKPATHEEEGKESIHCSVCGVIQDGSERVIPKVEHNYTDWVTIKEPDCTHDGSKKRGCTDCDYEEVVTLPATGHYWDSTYTVDKEATCKEAGSESIHCSVCGEIREGTERVIEKLKHTPGEGRVTKAPTTSEDGVMTYTCSACGDEYSLPIPKLEGEQQAASEALENAETAADQAQQAANSISEESSESALEEADAVASEAVSVAEAAEKEAELAVQDAAQTYGEDSEAYAYAQIRLEDTLKVKADAMMVFATVKGVEAGASAGNAAAAAEAAVKASATAGEAAIAAAQKAETEAKKAAKKAEVAYEAYEAAFTAVKAAGYQASSKEYQAAEKAVKDAAAAKKAADTAVAEAAELVAEAKSAAGKSDRKPAEDMGKDGTAVGPGASAAAAEKAITTMKTDSDPKGSVFSKLTVRSPKQTKNSIKLKWKKVSKATKYVIYGNKCGKSNKPKKLATVSGNTKTFKKILKKKVKKGTYYKFIIVALDKNNRVVSTSKLIHVSTKGGKVGNHKSVSVKKSVLNKARKLKVGSSLKLNAKAVAQSSKKKVRKHVAVRYESTNTKIATVSGKGVVKARKKGTCYVYAYAQSGVYKRIKVIVK